MPLANILLIRPLLYNDYGTIDPQLVHTHTHTRAGAGARTHARTHGHRLKYVQRGGGLWLFRLRPQYRAAATSVWYVDDLSPDGASRGAHSSGWTQLVSKQVNTAVISLT